MATYLDRAAIIAAQDLNYQDVDVPEWGGIVRVCGLSITQREELSLLMVDMSATMKAAAMSKDPDFSFQIDNAKLASTKAQVVVWTACDGEGKRLFAQKDVDAVGLKSPTVIERLYDVAMELSGANELTGDAITKNSGTGLSAGSDSA